VIQIRLLQRHPDPNDRMGLITLAAILWFFAGFGVLYLKTGSGTVGEAGTYTPAGDLVWIGPLVAWAIVFSLGPRGRLRVLWSDPVRLTVDDGGVAWQVPGQPEAACSWDELGGVSSGANWRSSWRSLWRRDGAELVTVRGPFVDEASGARVELSAVIVRVRPDTYEPLDPRHPDRACVRRAAA